MTTSTAGLEGSPDPSFLSSELKSYQAVCWRLTKQLQHAWARLNSLASENSFLKSELEVCHQTLSSSEGGAYPALRRHFEERLAEMQRRYESQEARLKYELKELKSAGSRKTGVAQIILGGENHIAEGGAIEGGIDMNLDGGLV